MFIYFSITNHSNIPIISNWCVCVFFFQLCQVNRIELSCLCNHDELLTATRYYRMMAFVRQSVTILSGDRVRGNKQWASNTSLDCDSQNTWSKIACNVVTTGVTIMEKEKKI